MKRITLFFILPFLFTLTSAAQDVNFEWVGQVPRCPAAGLENYCLGVDELKNVYTAGNYEYTNDFDPGAGEYNLTSVTPALDIYITKLDSYGKLIWAKSIGGKGDDFLGDLAVDQAGNLYCSGNFTEDSDLDPGPGTMDLGGSGGFLSKFDTDGNLIWAKKLKQGSNSSMAIDKDGGIYITGQFQQGEDLDPGPGVITTSTQGFHICVSKFDNEGNFLWVKMLLGNRGAYSQGIQVDKKKNIYVTGMHMGSIDADPGVNTFNLNSTDIFTFSSYLCKLDSLGNFKWAMSGIGDAIAVDDQENVISYNGNITKYDVNGQLVWVRATGGYPMTENDEKSRMVCVDSLGSIYISGSFQHTSDFDPGPGIFNMTAVDGIDQNDMFLSKLDAAGNFVWAKQIGAISRDMFYTMILDNSGNIYTTGIYIFTADFDPGPGVHNMTHFPGANFILKLSPCPGRTDSILHVNSCTSYKLNNSTYDLSGTYTQILRNAAGCDSLVTLILQLSNKVTETAVVACQEFWWQGTTYRSSGIYTDTLHTATGCDSIVKLNLTILPVSHSSFARTICEGDSVNGHFVSGVYVDTLVAINGCDSIRTLILFVQPRLYTTVTIAICEGQTYNGHTSPGLYHDTLISTNGCDSIVTIHLQVYGKKITNLYPTICRGISYGGYTSSGIYYDTLHAETGCDSIVVTHLTINELPKPALGADRNICFGEQETLFAGTFKSYLWQDNSTTERFIAKEVGTYIVKVTDANNCSSSDTVTINRIDPIPFNFLPANTKICNGEELNILVQHYGNYEWNTGAVTNNIVIEKPGRYILKVKDNNGCVGIDTLDIGKNDNCIPISIPKAFSPNEDRLNDFFKPILTQAVQEFNMEIYNRYGMKIFATSNPNLGWDGSYKGTKQNPGGYIYRIYFKNSAGFIYDKKGTVLLIR